MKLRLIHEPACQTGRSCILNPKSLLSFLILVSCLLSLATLHLSLATPVSAALFPPVTVDDSIGSPPNDDTPHTPETHDDPEHDFFSNQLQDNFVCEFDIPAPGASGNEGTGSSGTHIESDIIDFSYLREKITNNGGRDSGLNFSRNLIGRDQDEDFLDQQFNSFRVGVAERSSFSLDLKLKKSDYFTKVILSLQPGTTQTVVIDDTQGWACGGQGHDIDYASNSGFSRSACRPITTAEISYFFLTSGTSPFYERDENQNIVNIPFPGHLASILRSYFPSGYNANHPQSPSFSLIGNKDLYHRFYQALNPIPRNSTQRTLSIIHQSGKTNSEPQNVPFNSSYGDNFNSIHTQFRFANTTPIPLKEDFCPAAIRPTTPDKPAPVTLFGEIKKLVDNATGRILQILDAPTKVRYTYENSLKTGSLDYQNTYINFVFSDDHQEYKFKDPSLPQSSKANDIKPPDPEFGASRLGNFTTWNLWFSDWQKKVNKPFFEVVSAASGPKDTSAPPPPPRSDRPSGTPIPPPPLKLPKVSIAPVAECDTNAYANATPEEQALIDQYKACLGRDSYSPRYYNVLMNNPCLDDVILQSLRAGINPLLTITMWLHESDAGNASDYDFGVKRSDIGTDFNSQIGNFLGLVSPLIGQCQQYRSEYGDMDTFLARYSAAGRYCVDPGSTTGNPQEGKNYIDSINRFYDKISAKDASGNAVCAFPDTPFL